MAIKKGQQFDVEITEIAFGGKGLTRIDGQAVFVDQAIPGDQVNIQIIKKRKNYAEARIIELLIPSADRTKAPCSYSGFCGGCKWQFLKYEKQLVYKRQHVAECLEHIGFIRGVPVHPTIPSNLIFGYRNKMEFSCSDRRWLLPNEMGEADIEKDFAIGLHVPGTFYKVINTQACLLQPDFGNVILTDVRSFIKSSHKPVYGLRSHVGFWRFLMLRHSVAFNQWMVNIVTAASDRHALKPIADLLMQKYPEVISVINNVTTRRAGVATGEFEETIGGKPAIADKIGPYEFDISANSFFQTNTLGAKRLYDVVKDYAKLSGTETVLDLYSGTGTIPIILSDSAKEIIGIEIAESAVKDAEKNCKKNKILNCRFLMDDIRNCLPKITQSPDVLIIDPPRAGMHKEIVKQVVDMGPNRIVYVSCNPATLARDLSMMMDTFQVVEVQPVDMFPHTYHVEAVAKLAKKHAVI
ncbi:MAG: 23S rRNA (uracil(1939)-C(5))-methyltransferase RlmD [Desulfobacterales bacterium]|nr:MAG: 23S rRNA (uracil(1939)-C(5))-methyltransferase RlmD [Desulfobacterales bacterium]